MSTYMLIHGAWHGKWCWEKVIPLLEQKGHQVEVFDLPGSGEDTTPIAEVTLAAYTQRVSEALAAQTEPVILVGHSLGGTVISQAAEERPEKVKTLVYLSAFLAQNGQTVFQIAENDPASLAGRNVTLEQGTMAFREGAPLKDIFFADCSDEDAAYAISHLKPQALAPSATPLSITPERFGRIPRVYIECLQDRAVTPAFQKLMYTQVPCQTILSLDASHGAFFSVPQELANHLSSLSSSNE